MTFYMCLCVLYVPMSVFYVCLSIYVYSSVYVCAHSVCPCRVCVPMCMCLSVYLLHVCVLFVCSVD